MTLRSCAKTVAAFVSAARVGQKVSRERAGSISSLSPGSVCWLIEIKDYRLTRQTKTIDLAEELAEKARDTLAGLVAARINANIDDERDQARAALKCCGLRV